ncbi:MAG TPA: NYN domain-containing protein [Chloroflexia bacterium]|nr:NYN domain-containing protein [Chloroflexia bacterium]
MARAAWLVDVGYVVKASEGRFKLDYLRAERYLESRCGPIRSYLFNGVDPAYGIPPGLQRFYDAMTGHGMTVRLHPMQSFGPHGGNRQRRVDVDFSAHLVWQACQAEIDTVVLTTGDQDFVPAVQLARNEFEKRVVLFTYDTMVHHDLIACASEWWKFEEAENRVARW